MKQELTSNPPCPTDKNEPQKKPVYYVDGAYLPSDKAVIPVDDLAVLRGIGVCDLMRTVKGKPFLLRDHVTRLISSAQSSELSIRWPADEIEEIILETLKRNRVDNQTLEANIRTIITGGSSSDFITPTGPARLLVLVTPIPPIPAHWYEKGVKVITVLYQRALPEAKTLSYMPASLALKQAKERGAVEALYVNTDNIVTEATTSNLFAFIHGKLVTADVNVLKGITRQAILEAAQGLFEIELRSMTLDTLYSAEEVFISGTNKGIVPVVQIDDKIVGTGAPGEKTKKLITALENESK